MIEFLREFFDFLTKRKKYWLYPCHIFLFGILIVFTQGMAVYHSFIQFFKL